MYPGSSVSLAYGEIKTGMLDLGGNYSALNWTVGTLELTNTNVVLDNGVVGTYQPARRNVGDRRPADVHRRSE